MKIVETRAYPSNTNYWELGDLIRRHIGRHQHPYMKVVLHKADIRGAATYDTRHVDIYPMSLIGVTHQ